VALLLRLVGVLLLLLLVALLLLVGVLLLLVGLLLLLLLLLVLLLDATGNYLWLDNFGSQQSTVGPAHVVQGICAFACPAFAAKDTDQAPSTRKVSHWVAFSRCPQATHPVQCTHQFSFQLYRHQPASFLPGAPFQVV
jgi:hypothetical protein